MKYTLLMFTDPAKSDAMSPAEFERVMDKRAALRSELGQRSALVRYVHDSVGMTVSGL